MRIGVDVGGTKIEGILIGDDGRELVRRRISTPAGEYEAIVAAIKGLVGDLEQEAGGEASVGVGHPGAISPATGLMKNSNSTVLNGRPFDRDLEAALGRQIVTSNDADCFALSEATDGAGAGFGTVFGAILGTGVGGGVVVHGRLVRGPNAVTGEWGHNQLPWGDESEMPGPICYCGRRGCIETFLSGPGMETDFARATGRYATSREIVDGFRRGEPVATGSVDRYVGRLARGLASVINVLDPDVIVLGGGMSNIDEVYARVPVMWEEWVFSDGVSTRLRRAVHGDSSGVRGAAWLGGVAR
ncbi:MAG: ROK family protein [Acidimicrobiia bacterium]